MTGLRQPGRRTARRTGRHTARKSLTASRARFERRATAVRRRPARLAGILLALLAVLAGAGWVVGFSPLLAVRTVRVSGLSDAGEREAVRAAAGIAMGTPLARVDTGGAAARIDAVATVDSVEVGRSWPSSLTVVVHRRVPVLVLKDPQGQLKVVDRKGVAFQVVPQAPAGVPLVNATTSAPDPGGLRAALSVLQLLPAAERAEVSDVRVTSADLVTFRLGPTTVIWGGVEDGPRKLTVLRTLLTTGPAVVDVSAADTPVTR